MRRIILLVALICIPSAMTQATERTFRLAILAGPGRIEARAIMVVELAKRGLIEGRNLVIDDRVGAPEQLPDLARALLEAKPDAIVAISAAAAAAKSATSIVPIVTFGPDPVAQGLALSFARPGGNVTGIVILAAELDGKRMQLLNEALPSRRVAVLLHPGTQTLRQSRQEITDVAASIGVEPLFFDATEPDDYPAAFNLMRSIGADSLFIAANPWFFRDRELLGELARQAGLATICEWPEMAASSCLIGYGPRRAELYGRAADLVRRIFQGTPPGDLPIEQPTNFELVINLQIAKTLGIVLPPGLLVCANEVIE